MIIDERLDAVVRAGLFPDRNRAIEEATRTLFAVRPQLRTEAALLLFREGQVSFLRASEIAGLDVESFRQLLSDRGISWNIEVAPQAELDEAIHKFFPPE